MNKEIPDNTGELDYFDSPDEIAARQRRQGSGMFSRLYSKLRTFFRSPGIIAGQLLRLCDAISSCFRGSLTASLMERYGSADADFGEKNAERAAESGAGKMIRRFKRAVSALADRSAISALNGSESMLISLRAFGTFFVTFGAYTLIMWVIKAMTGTGSGQSAASLTAGAAMAIASVPLLFSQMNVSQALEKSRFFRSILVDAIGIPPENLGRSSVNKTPMLPFAVAGIILGILSYFIGAHLIIAVLAGIVLLLLLFEYPEIGPGLLVAAVPLTSFLGSPSVTLGGLTILLALAFLLKVVRGKRNLLFGLTEIPVALLILTVLLSGFPVRETSMLHSALLSAVLMSSYLLSVNLVRRRHALGTCTVFIIICAASVSLAGIVQYFAGLAPSGWTDTHTFSSITSRATSVFANPNMLGFYLIMAFPLALSATHRSHSAKTRLLGFLTSLLITVCAVLTWSRAAWLGLAAGGIFFAAAVSARNLLVLPWAAAGTAVAARLLPDTLGARLSAFSSLGDSANAYRRGIWKGVGSMLKDVYRAGVGAGEYGFRSVYLSYAEQGIEAAPHAHSIYLQLLASSGIPGLAFFLIAVICLLMKVGSCLLTSKDRKTAVTAAALAGGVVAVLAAGIFDSVFYNYRLLFAFWQIAGLASAGANIARAADKSGSVTQSTPESAEISVKISDDGR